LRRLDAASSRVSARSCARRNASAAFRSSRTAVWSARAAWLIAHTGAVGFTSRRIRSAASASPAFFARFASWFRAAVNSPSGSV
jgi:hypothetical protein